MVRVDRADAKIIVSTFFSALIGVTLGNAVTCIGNGCWATDARDITVASLTVLSFLIVYFIIVRSEGKHRPRRRRRNIT